MGAIDRFLSKYDPDPREAFAIDPDAATLARLETTTYETVNALPALTLTDEDRGQWRGRSTTKLGYLLRTCAQGLDLVPDLAQAVGLSAAEAQATVARDTACCGYIKVLEAIIDGAECGELRAGEQATALIKQLQRELAAVQKTLPPAKGAALGATFAASMREFADLQSLSAAASPKGSQAQRLEEQLVALIDRDTMKRAVRDFLTSLQQRGAQALTGLLGDRAQNNHAQP